ncbi:MAG: hypothetical protein HPY84_13735 [Syntrophobacteraceae bacterium]|nr:hypothetical protein [Syntrophobacteraceae bacterium]
MDRPGQYRVEGTARSALGRLVAGFPPSRVGRWVGLAGRTVGMFLRVGRWVGSAGRTAWRLDGVAVGVAILRE